MNATWLIGALFEFLTCIEVGWLAEVLTPHPPSALCVTVELQNSSNLILQTLA